MYPGSPLTNKPWLEEARRARVDFTTKGPELTGIELRVGSGHFAVVVVGGFCQSITLWNAYTAGTMSRVSFNSQPYSINRASALLATRLYRRVGVLNLKVWAASDVSSLLPHLPYLSPTPSCQLILLDCNHLSSSRKLCFYPL